MFHIPSIRLHFRFFFKYQPRFLLTYFSQWQLRSFPKSLKSEWILAEIRPVTPTLRR